MRSHLLPIIGLSLLAIAVAVVMGSGTSTPTVGKPPADGPSLTSRNPSSPSEVTPENASRDSLVSRHRRSKSPAASVTRRPSPTQAAALRPSTPEGIAAAIRSSAPTTLSALRPIDFPVAHAVASNPSDLIAVNPEAPGNRLTTSEQSITVEAYQPFPAGNELTVQITPSTHAPAASFGSGFTLEEEQFRTKWGWAAFDQVQRTAKIAAAESH